MVTPDPIVQLALGFWSSKTLLSAVELGLFTELAKGPLDLATLTRRLALNPRSTRDFFDALVALGMLARDDGGLYSNTPETAEYLDRSKRTYIGGMLEMVNTRLYGFWGSLTEALRTGQPQNEIRRGQDLFGALYTDPARLKLFLSAMTGFSLHSARSLAGKFPWQKYKTFVDVGGAQGALPVQIALAHPHISGGVFDLPVVGPIFEEYAAGFGLSDRLRFHPGDFFKDPLPRADVIVMARILHDWDLEQKRLLIGKAFEALPAGGAYIVVEMLIDDERRSHVPGFMMSLNMLIETRGGFDFTGADCAGWMREAGFRQTRVEHIAGADHMCVGLK